MLIPSEHPPVAQPLSPLFAAAGAAPADEARRMIAAARAIMDGDDPDAAVELAWYAVDGAARAAFDLAEAGALPLAAVDVVAGLTGLSRPKDYGVKPIWSLAWELVDEPAQDAALLDEDTLEIIASMEAACGPDAARELRERFEKAEREERAGQDPGSAPEPPAEGRERRRADRAATDRAWASERAALADRIGLLGAGGSSRADLREARPLLWLSRGAGPAWEALCMAFDAVGAASPVGLDRLGALADASPGSPAILWLDELACRLARERGRASRRAEALDTLLGSGAFGRNASAIALSIGLGRKALAEQGDRAHDAWLRLAASRRADTPRTAAYRDTLPPVDDAARRGAGQRGGGLARILPGLSEGWARAEREGPFYELDDVPHDVDGVLDPIAHMMVLGFRELYGLELLRAALPRLEDALAAVRSGAA
jgi:hypothetical protein